MLGFENVVLMLGFENVVLFPFHTFFCFVF